MEFDRHSSIGSQLEAVCAPALQEYGNLVQKIEDTSARMASKTQCKNLDHYLHLLTSADGIEDAYYDHNVFLTDSPEMIPFPATVYHVTV